MHYLLYSLQHLQILLHIFHYFPCHLVGNKQQICEDTGHMAVMHEFQHCRNYDTKYLINQELLVPINENSLKVKIIKIMDEKNVLLHSFPVEQCGNVDQYKMLLPKVFQNYQNQWINK